MHFQIVTPSFNQLDFLKRCSASVHDQLGAISDKQLASSSGLNANDCQLMAKSPLSVHHHIQDGGSKDGTVDWLRQYDAEDGGRRTEDGDSPNAQRPEPRAALSGYTFSYENAPDNGMYDAINRGVKLAIESTRHQAPGSSDPNNHQPSTINSRNQMVAWLNCDEQYLPGTLEFVGEYFSRHPEVDMLFGDYLMVDEEGELLSFRKGCAPRLRYIQASHLNNLSCAMFFRSTVFQFLWGFDAKYKAVADEDFVVRALQAGFKARHVRRYFSVFTFTGSNLGGGTVGREEFASLKKGIPLLLKLFKIPLNLSRWIEKLLGGTYLQKFPLSYSIYAGDTDARREFVSQRAGWKWPASGPEGPTPRREDG